MIGGWSKGVITVLVAFLVAALLDVGAWWDFFVIWGILFAGSIWGRSGNDPS